MAARKILVPYNFTQQEIQNAVVQVLGAAPSSPVAGQVYFDSTTSAVTWRNAANSAWINPLARSNHTGTQAWSTITSTPTTLSGYGITDAQPLDADLSAIAALAGTSGLLRKTAADTWSLDTSTYLTSNQSISVSGDASGSGTTAITLTLATVNASPQTDQFRKITVNGKGLVTATSAVSAADIPTLTSAKISDFDTQVRTSRLDQMAAPAAAVSLNSQRITNLAAPTADTDAATKKYVDDSIAGLSWKDEVRVATTTAGTLASSFANGSTVDGVVLATGDRILIKDQSTASQNGIYTVNASGAPTRALDANTGAEISGAAVFVTNGTTNGGTRWVCSTQGVITIDSTSLAFVQFGGGSTYTAGNGLTLSGNDFNVGAGTGITVTADAVAIDTAVVARKVTALIGNGSATSIGVTHSLGNQWVTAQVIEVATLSMVDCDIVMTDANTTTFIFSVAPTTNQYRVIITG